MEAGVCIVSEGLPREDSHSEKMSLSLSWLVSHVTELLRCRAPTVPFHLPIFDMRKWAWGTFMWRPEADSLTLALQPPTLTRGAGQAERAGVGGGCSQVSKLLAH